MRVVFSSRISHCGKDEVGNVEQERLRVYDTLTHVRSRILSASSALEVGKREKRKAPQQKALQRRPQKRKLSSTAALNRKPKSLEPSRGAPFS